MEGDKLSLLQNVSKHCVVNQNPCDDDEDGNLVFPSSQSYDWVIALMMDCSLKHWVKNPMHVSFLKKILLVMNSLLSTIQSLHGRDMENDSLMFGNLSPSSQSHDWVIALMLDSYLRSLKRWLKTPTHVSFLNKILPVMNSLLFTIQSLHGRDMENESLRFWNLSPSSQSHYWVISLMMDSDLHSSKCWLKTST